ncbi:MAG: lamin tail domain-containing protein, partial [Limisphaerales bacterium]
QVIDSIHYGFQVANTSIGRDKNGDWELLTSPTPGKANALPRLTATASNVVINEWSTGGRGDDWIELYNPNPLPVDLGGNHLTDDLSSIGRTKFEIPPLNFISPGGFVKWIADGDLSKGGDHLNFSLADLGEQVALYSRSKTLIEKVQTGQTKPGESEGRLPDGSSTIVAFTDTPTPGRSNYKPIESVVINEVLTHTDPPYEDAIELRNLGEEPLDIGKWWLSNSRSNLRKYQIPAGTTLPARGTTVFYEHQFNPAPGADHSFALNSAHGDKVILSAADSGGDLTGYRITVEFDAAENGVSFGLIKTSQGDQFATLSRPTFGLSQPVTLAAFRKGTGEANSGPSVGPVVLHEIMYHPAPLPHGAGTPDDEFIELRNITNRSVPLYDPLHPVNTWWIDGGVKYEFPVGTRLAAGEYALVVEFDPVKEPEQAKRLAKRYDIPEGTTL